MMTQLVSSIACGIVVLGIDFRDADQLCVTAMTDRGNSDVIYSVQMLVNKVVLTLNSDCYICCMLVFSKIVLSHS